MTVITSTNQNQYLDWVLNEQAITQRDAIIASNKKRKHKKPDDDLRRAITGDELLAGIYKDLEIFFATK